MLLGLSSILMNSCNKCSSVKQISYLNAILNFLHHSYPHLVLFSSGDHPLEEIIYLLMKSETHQIDR